MTHANRRFSCLLVALLLITPSLVARADNHAMTDMRTEVIVSESDRNRLLKEMRDFLQGMQAITHALANQDMAAVAKAAKPLGMAMMDDIPKSLRMSFPKEFRSIAMATHRDFDAIALDAEQLGDPQHTLSQLSNATAKCVGCHASYRFAE